jgi:hypothetical protein
VTFNDTIIPTFTFYRVAATAADGSSVPGFPQNWYLAGTSVDVSNGYPLAAVGQQTRFPTPLLANPSSNAQQSVASPVTLNGYALTAGAILLPANASPPACTGTTSLIYTDNSTGEIQFCQNGGTVTGILDWHDSATDSLTGNQLILPAFNESDPASGKYLLLVYDTANNKSIIKSHQYGGTDQDEDLQVVAADLTLSISGTSAFNSIGAFTQHNSSTTALTLDGAVTATLASTLTATVTGNVSLTGADTITLTGGTGGVVISPAIITDSATLGSISVKQKVVDYAANGAITIQSGVSSISKTSAANMTLADPTSAQAGTHIFIISKTAFAHVVTNASAWYGAATTIATFTATQGSFLELMAIDGKWKIISSVGITLS